MYKVKRTGDKTPPCFTPLLKEKERYFKSPHATQVSCLR